MDVEVLAVTKISNMIARCPHIKGFITTNDKTPFTDGHIDVYSGLRQTKSEFRGRVSVQVKGRSGTISKASPSYSIAREELMAFRRDSGVLYFVVAVGGSSQRPRITPYYVNLSPFEIDYFLSTMSADQKTVSVPLKKLPHEAASLERIVFFALKTREQGPIVAIDPVLLDHAESFTMVSPTDLDFSVPVILKPGTGSFALVLNTLNGMSIPLPGELHIYPSDYVEREHQISLCSGLSRYTSAMIRRINEDVVGLRLSDALELRLHMRDGQQTISATLTPAPTLSSRLKAFEFVSALVAEGFIEIDGVRSLISVTRTDDEGELAEHLRFLRELNALFETLEVDTGKVILDEIDLIQFRQLHILHRVLVEGEEVDNPDLEVSRVIQHVGALGVVLVLLEGSQPGKWRYIDPFSRATQHQFRWSSDDENVADGVPITPFDIVDENFLPIVLNMRLSGIVEAYQQIESASTTTRLANERILALLRAADQGSALSDELLGAARRLNEWLIEREGEEPHHLVNRWQINFRSGELTKDQRGEIRALGRRMARDAHPDLDLYEMAFAALLGDREAYVELAERLPSARREILKGWPISALVL